MARKPKVEASEATTVVTEPKVITYAQLAQVASMSFNGLKGDSHAETRRKINDARNFIAAVNAAKVAKANNTRDAKRRYDAMVSVVNQFQLRYGVVVVKQA
jgi:hypothetical protein